MSELKSCPFCGNEVEVEKIPLWHENGHGYSGCYEFKIKCESCGCTVNQPKNDSIYRSEEKARENAIEAWNKRVKKNEDDETRRTIDEESYDIPADGREDRGRDQGNP